MHPLDFGAFLYTVEFDLFTLRVEDPALNGAVTQFTRCWREFATEFVALGVSNTVEVKAGKLFEEDDPIDWVACAIPDATFDSFREGKNFVPFPQRNISFCELE